MLWARKYRGYTKKDWEKVLFADESKFEIFGNKRRIYVRRRKNAKLVSFCFRATVKHGGGTIQVWGCFSYNGVGDLYKINCTLKREQYHSILQRHAIPSVLRLCGKVFMLLQDNDPKHASHLWKSYLKKKVVMNFPPQSPDLND